MRVTEIPHEGPKPFLGLEVFGDIIQIVNHFGNQVLEQKGLCDGLIQNPNLATMDVLLGATVRPARWIDAKGDWGMVSAGARADLILVDGDPVADITVMAKVEEVLKSGVRLERQKP